MSKPRYKLTDNKTTGVKTLVAYVDGDIMPLMDSNHSNFDEAVKLLRVVSDDRIVADPETIEYLKSLFDLPENIRRRFSNLSERVEVDPATGDIYIDGKVDTGPLPSSINRALEAGQEGVWKPLVAFWENVRDNPFKEAREAIVEWLKHEDFSITDDGMIVGYKSVQAKDGRLYSWHTGNATINGNKVVGQVPQKVGQTVRMNVKSVDLDHRTACSTGLHVGTWGFAKSFYRGELQQVIVEVHVNPKDVVSTPNGYGKFRCLEYKIKRIAEDKHNDLVIGRDYAYV